MRNVMKAATLESRFPLMAVEHGCIISKDADITVAYRLELPEVFTLTRAEYEPFIPHGRRLSGFYRTTALSTSRISSSRRVTDLTSAGMT